MLETPPSQSETRGIRVGDVGGDVNFSALGDIVGGDKITTITTTIQISVEAVTQRTLVTSSPYRGLDRFEDRDKDLFFGRDQLIKSLLAQLSASNVLLVLGASGSGKSSVVRAGLLPQLSQLIGARFRYFTFVPDVNPFESLRSALQAAGFTQSQTRELADARPETPAKLIPALQRSGDQWLFFVDQFEEIFTVGDEKLRANFIASLTQIAQDRDSSTKLVLAMRADFLDRFSPFPQFAKIIEKNIDIVADMHADELRQAIEQPAARHGVVFEQGLVEEIIKDVQGQAGSLPLLQYTLDLLWQEEASRDGLTDRHLNTQTYHELGGVRGALQKRANEIFSSFGNAADTKTATAKQEIVRQIFLRLVDLAGEGPDSAAWRPVRRRVSMATFANAQEQEILQALIDAKLLVSNREGDDATVEVAHEALFTSWERLRSWIEAGKQVIFAKNRLADDARRWQRRQEEGDSGADEELLSGSRLAQALDMRGRGDFVTVVGGLGKLETQFLDGSIALRNRRAQEEDARQKRELAAAQNLAAVQKVAAGRLRIGLAVAVVLLLVAAGLALFAKAKGNEAAARRAQAENVSTALMLEKSATKTALSRSDRETAGRLAANQEPAAAIAYLAHSLENDPRNRIALADMLTTALETSWLIPAATPVQLTSKISDVSFSPDSTRILVNVGQHAEVNDWQLFSRSDQNEMRLLAQIQTEKYLAFSFDGRRILEVSREEDREAQGVARWDSANGALVPGKQHLEKFSQKSRYRAEFKPGAAPGTVRVKDAAGKPIGAPLYLALPVSEAWVAPDGTHAVTCDRQDEGPANIHVSVWRLGELETDSGKLLYVSDTFPRSVRFSPGGRYVALGLNYNTDEPNRSELYRLDSTATSLRQVVEFFADLRVADFSADGRYAISTHAQGQLQLWHLADPSRPMTPTTSNETANSDRNPRLETIAGLGDRGHPGEKLDNAALAKLDLASPTDDPDLTVEGWSDPSGRYVLFQGKKSWELWDSKIRHQTVLGISAETDLDKVLFSSDGRWLALQNGSNPAKSISATLHLIALETGAHQMRALTCDDFTFSKSGRFLLTFDRAGDEAGDAEIQVFDTATLELCTTYHNPIQDKLWAGEKIFALESTPQLCGVLTALGGKRLGANGSMENVPPTEWLRLRAEPKQGTSLADTVVHWILDWPKDRYEPPF